MQGENHYNVKDHIVRIQNYQHKKDHKGGAWYVDVISPVDIICVGTAAYANFKTSQFKYRHTRVSFERSKYLLI